MPASSLWGEGIKPTCLKLIEGLVAPITALPILFSPNFSGQTEFISYDRMIMDQLY